MLSDFPRSDLMVVERKLGRSSSEVRPLTSGWCDVEVEGQSSSSR